MPAPTTIPELLDRVRRSGLVPADLLDGFLTGLAASGQEPATIPRLLDRLVDVGMITRFHADRLAAGKYKGFQLGSYLILDHLMNGGMGQVYLAEHTAMRRLVALKVLPVFSADDLVARERFLRESRAAAALDHPNIVRVFDLCQEGKLLYLVMEYVDGISLQALVAKAGKLPIDAACHYARQVAFGLQHAHELGFVHRDIKPANLLVDRVGVVKILDLGLVRCESDIDSGLTKKHDNASILGTADYMAPEQAVDSSTVDIRADIYSLGATLYFLLTGRPLFTDGRTAQKLVWQQIKDPTPIRRLRPDLPHELAGVVHTMLQKRPEDRFRTPAEVFDALAPWAQEEVPPPDDAVMPRPPARVAVSRQAVAAGGARASGSTSQILALAMRSGPISATELHRPVDGGGKSNSGVITPAPRRSLADAADHTHEMAAAETIPAGRQPGRRPPPEPAPAEPEPAAGSRNWQLVAVVAALAVSALLAALGIAILVTHGS